MSCVPFDIQRLKLDVAKSHYAKASITYNYLVFSTNLRNISCENYLLKGKIKCKHMHFIQRLSTNCMGKWFLIINKPTFSRNIFCYIWSFWKGYLVAKNWQLHYYMFHNPSLGLVIKARACKVASQEGSMGVTFHAFGNVGECEGRNPHILKWAPTLGVGVPMDSQIFREQL
jgi:hypothetical protein